MEFSLDHNTSRFKIEAYEPGCVTINGQKYTSSVLLLPEEIIYPWGPHSIEELKHTHFNAIATHNPQIVLLGTGDELVFPNQSLFTALYEKQLGIEIMTTPAACRTYTLLTSEGRLVAAGLL